MESPLRAALIAEVYGTFLLTLIGPMSITIASNPRYFQAGQYLGLGFIGFAFGIALLVGIVTVARFSGAHFNPAITVGLAYAGRFPRNRVLPYVVAQLVGATLAGFTQLAMVGVDLAKTTDLGNTFPNPALPLPLFSALLSEIIGTMILGMTILGATHEDSPSWGPSAIGLSLAAIVWALGGMGGASLNPARTFGPSIVSLLFDPNVFNACWIYVVGPLLGALLAAEIYRTMAGRWVAL